MARRDPPSTPRCLAAQGMRKGLNVMSVNYPEGWSDMEKLGAGRGRLYRIWESLSRVERHRRKMRKRRRQRQLEIDWSQRRTQRGAQLHA